MDRITRKELVNAVRQGYQSGSKSERTAILNEFIKITGFHRKHAIRVLGRCGEGVRGGGVAGQRIYNVAVQEALIVVWEAFMDCKENYGYKCGLEGEIEGFKARAGYIYTTNPNITIGFGIPEGKWRIDYAFLYHWDLGITHRFSMGVNF